LTFICWTYNRNLESSLKVNLLPSLRGSLLGKSNSQSTLRHVYPSLYSSSSLSQMSWRFFVFQFQKVRWLFWYLNWIGIVETTSFSLPWLVRGIWSTNSNWISILFPSRRRNSSRRCSSSLRPKPGRGTILISTLSILSWRSWLLLFFLFVKIQGTFFLNGDHLVWQYSLQYARSDPLLWWATSTCAYAFRLDACVADFVSNHRHGLVY